MIGRRDADFALQEFMASPPDPPEFEYIDTQDALRAVVEQARSADVYGIDTEFHREKTFFARVCLVQLAFDDRVALIDALAVDLAALRPLLDGDGLCVVHACSQDLEILVRECGTLPNRLFDPQVAASFIGMSTPSLGTLVYELLGISLKKGAQLSDWTRRPLGGAELRYAADDVAFLSELTNVLRERLAERGRLEWADEECSRVLESTGEERDPRTLWWKVKGARKFDRRSAGVAQELCIFRDRLARERDVPLRHAVADMPLQAMVGRPPRREKDLRNVRGLHLASLRGWEEELLAAVTRGLALSEDEIMRPPSRVGDRVPSGVLALAMAWLAQRAADESVDQAALATRDDVESFITDGTSRLGEGWRHRLVGSELERLVRGELAIVIEGERLVAKAV